MDVEAQGGPAPRQSRRGPAPIASFDHDGSDESSPETKQTFRLPEIREHPAAAGSPDGGGGLLAAPAGGRARSHSTPAAGALPAPAPRIDISRASSSSHHDSRDSSPELALFAGDASDGCTQRLELAFREDGALDLRSSTEELSFMEPAPGEPRPAPPPTPAPPPAPGRASAALGDRRHSRKDSQSSEAALLAVSGRTSRLSSVGSACSAQSRVSRLSVVSGASRSPSPHRMLLETSFCGPKPIETDPEACAALVAEHILEIARRSSAGALPPAPAAGDARDRREVRTEVTVEPPAPRPPRQPALALSPVMAPAPTAPAPQPETRARPEERRARPRVRREPSEPEVYKSRNKSKDIIRIKLRPDEEEDEEEPGAPPRAPAPARAAPPSPAPSRRRSPSPAGPPSGSRKSSFCSLFKSRETIGSPESPQAQEALRRKRSLTEGRARSGSRDRSGTPTSSKIRGSVLSLFRGARRSAASSPPSRATSPAPAPHPPAPASAPAPAPPRPAHTDKLKYYEEASNGVIHIPLRTPPEERAAALPRPASAPQPGPAPPTLRTVLPDGSIIIPLRSPTEREPEAATPDSSPAEPRPTSARPDAEPASSRPTAAMPSPTSTEPATATVPSPPREARPTPPEPVPSPPDRPPPEPTSRRRKERLVFTTHVGSREQVFSTQFSITKTPSVTSEISGSFPSFENGEFRDSHITADPLTPPPAAGLPAGGAASATSVIAPPVAGEGALPPQDLPRDSSESEPSSEAAPPQVGNDVERRGLVVQESFEEELPYIPTTLPQERSVAVPMVPVRERGGVLVRSVQRPRATPVPAPAPAPVPAPSQAAAAFTPAPGDKLRIKLPRRPRVSSAPAPTPSRERARSGSASGTGEGGENKAKQEWIDFEEVPERRKQPKRIQTLPAGAAGEGGVLFSYVEPEHCRCECHANARDDTMPLLSEMHNSRISTSSAECGGVEEESVPGAETAPRRPPFTTDLDLRHDHAPIEPQGSRP